MFLRSPLSFRATILLTVVPLVAAATGLVALVSHLYDRRVAEAVSATVPRAEVMDLIRAERQWHLVLVLILIGVAILLAVFLARRVADPVYRLQKQVHTLSAGVQAAPVARTGPAELQALAADFQRMTETVASRERELAEREAVFRSLFDHTSDLVTLFRVPPAGPLVCLNANPATLSAAGLPREKVIGATFDTNLPRPDAEWLEARFLECARSARPVSYERRIELNTGERWLNTVLVPLPGPDGRIDQVASVSRDVTEQRRAETALSESEAFLTELVESASDAIVAVDERDTVLLFNAAAERMFGVRADEIFGRPVARLIPIGLAGKVGARSVEARRGDGTAFPAEMAASCLKAGGRSVCTAILRDVSNRQRAEVELRSSERRFAQAFYDSPAMMSITRLSDRVLLDVNDRWVKTVGVSRETAVGRKAEDLGLVVEHDQADELFRRLRADHSARDLEFTARLPDGSTMRGIGSVSVIDVDGDDGILWSGLDLTERLRAEEETRRLTAELERRVQERTAQLADANQELESFSYSVSHDLRAPLRSIDGFSKALLEDCGDQLNAEGQDYLSRVRAASQRMGELIDDLLNLSRVSRGELNPTSIDLSNLARRLIEGYRVHHPGRSVEVSIAPDVRAVGDPNLLRVVMDNLLGNAWKYTAKGPNARIEVGVQVHDGERVYHVRDNGTGFDATYADKLFIPFQRLHGPDEFEGHGIGLATVRRVINRHRGRVWAEGQVNRGATFYFTLGTDPPAE